MTKLRVNAFGLSLEGYGAGPHQDLKNPLGVGGFGLHEWFYPTRTFQAMYGKGEGTAGVDDDFAARGLGLALRWWGGGTAADDSGGEPR